MTVSSPESTLLSRREAIRRATLFLGVALSPSLITGALEAQTTAAADSKPQYLTAKEFMIVKAISDRILPATDTPGASEVGVPAFIDLMVGKYLSADERVAFSAGLAAVEASSMAAYRQPFARLKSDEQDAMLQGLAQSNVGRERAFFHKIRELTVVGYFTSETVGKTVLHYNPVPGAFDACLPLSEVGNRTWTT